MSIISRIPFHDEHAAFEYLEATLWPDGAICPHCGTIGNATKLQGKATRIGVWKCNEKPCRKQFTVKVGTVFEHGRIPLHKMLQAAYLLCCSKKGCSSHQLHRILQITYKSAWFLSHRIREAMRDGTLPPLGGDGRVVEADETYYGPVDDPPTRRKRGGPYLKKGKHGGAGKRPIIALVERGGNVRTFHVPVADKGTVTRIVWENIARESQLHTDESALYNDAEDYFDAHKTVKHSVGEYVRKEIEWNSDGTEFRAEKVHTNSAEGYFGIFKRGMRGIYQHCGEKHLHRYLAEFEFRYNNRVRLGVDDTTRTAKALRGIVGKRLTYRAADH